MTQFQLLLLSKLIEPAECLIALNDAGEILISHPEKAARNGSFPANGVCGIRFHVLTGKRLSLRYALPTSPTQAVSVTAMNRRGEVVGGYPGSIGSEGSHGLFWDVQGKMTALSGGAGIAINDAGQILTDDTHVTDGQLFGDCTVRLAPGTRGRPIGVLRLSNATSSVHGPFARSINQQGAVAGPGLTLWQSGAYEQGHIVERDNRDNANTPFAGGNRPVITEEGIIVCLGTSPRPSSPEMLRFHRWKAGATSTAIPFRFPADSSFYVGSRLITGVYRLTTVGANARGEILLNVEGECITNGKKQRRTEAVLWHKDGTTQLLPQLRSGLLLNNRGWIVGITSQRVGHYVLLRPKE